MENCDDFILYRFDADAADIFSKLLLYDKDKRMVAQPAMSHPYFKSLGPAAVTLMPRKFFHESNQSTCIYVFV